MKYYSYLLCIIWGFALGGLITISAMRSARHKDAIEARVAEWRIDPKTGEKTFHYLTPP